MTTYSRMQKLAGLLNEVGEANLQPYSFEYSDTGESLDYYFTTDEDIRYVAQFETFDEFQGHPMTSFFFKTENGTSDEVVNKGEVFKVMSTITAIIKDYVERLDPMTIEFSPSKSKGANDMRRAKLYVAFIKKSLPAGYSWNQLTQDDFVIQNDSLMDAFNASFMTDD